MLTSEDFENQSDQRPSLLPLIMEQIYQRRKRPPKTETEIPLPSQPKYPFQKFQS